MTENRIATDVAVSARDITKIYGKGTTAVTALDNVSIDFPRERFTAIMGPSGSGKSTLMHCLAGLDSVTSGTVRIGSSDITSMNDAKLTVLRRERVGFIFQAFNLIPTLTAEENITLPLALAGKKPDPQWLQTIVTTLGLTKRIGHKPHELSGGQQQRVAVARALLTKPDVIFGDEPTGNLDSQTGTEVLTLLQNATRDLGQTVVMVTHDPTAAAYADQVVMVADGRLAGKIENPTADQVLKALGNLTAPAASTLSRPVVSRGAHSRGNQ